MRTAFVTGGSGHVGGNLVRLLLKKGWTVRCLIHKDMRALEGLNIEKVKGDLLDEDFLCDKLSGCDAVFHAAAQIAIENVDLEFTEDGIDTIANIANEVNSTVENIGARRLHTIIERVLDEISFTATDRAGEKITVDSKYIQENIGELVKDTDLSKFIL